MPKKTFPIEEICVLLETGATIEEIAKKYSTSRPTMSKFLKENNLQTQKQKQLDKCKEVDALKVKELYEQGECIKEIAEKLGVST